MTLANLVIGSQVSYRAVEHMETVQFCGQSCHVMKPEFTAHLRRRTSAWHACTAMSARAPPVGCRRRWPERAN